jgi:hypothetical protein
VDLAAGDLRTPLVQQAGQGAHQAGLSLAALAEQHQVVAGQERCLELGKDCVVEADDTGEGGFAGPEAGDEIGADLLFDGPRDVSGFQQLAESGRRRVLSRRCRHEPTLGLPAKSPESGRG